MFILLNNVPCGTLIRIMMNTRHGAYKTQQVTAETIRYILLMYSYIVQCK